MSNIKGHRVRDVEMRSMQDGSGEPLLFLHGAAGLPRWNLFFQALAKQFDVCVPEHPGFGLSVAPRRIRTIADLAMHYLDLMDELDLSGVHLVGHSMGGWIAAELATRNSTRLASLTLIAPAGLRLKGLPCGDNFIWSAEEAVRNLYHDQGFAEQILAHVPTEDEAEILLRNRVMAARLGWEPRWFDPALSRWLHRIRVPTHVMWGENDKVFPPAYAAAWTGGIPHSSVELVGACGHLPHIEKPAETAGRLLAFLEGI